jgi:hypothetical protein
VIQGDSDSLLIVIIQINLIGNCNIQWKFNSLVKARTTPPMQGHASLLPPFDLKILDMSTALTLVQDTARSMPLMWRVDDNIPWKCI